MRRVKNCDSNLNTSEQYREVHANSGQTSDWSVSKKACLQPPAMVPFLSSKGLLVRFIHMGCFFLQHRILLPFTLYFILQSTTELVFNSPATSASKFYKEI